MKFRLRRVIAKLSVTRAAMVLQSRQGCSGSAHDEGVRMYVCPKCNSLVGQPKTRWWSGWRYCPNSHVLYVRGLGPSLEQSFWKSFLRALARRAVAAAARA